MEDGVVIDIYPLIYTILHPHQFLSQGKAVVGTLHSGAKAKQSWAHCILVPTPYRAVPGNGKLLVTQATRVCLPQFFFRWIEGPKLHK